MLQDVVTLSPGTSQRLTQVPEWAPFGSLRARLPYHVCPTYRVAGWAETGGLQSTEIHSNWHFNKRGSLLQGHRSVLEAGMWSRTGMKDRTAHRNQELLLIISPFCFSWRIWADPTVKMATTAPRAARDKEGHEDTALLPIPPR